MTEAERALRITITYEHHSAYGTRIEDDDVRAQTFIDDTRHIPIEIFRAACQRARRTHEGTFPPSSGQVVTAARDFCRDRWPERYRAQNGGVGNPKWYQQMLRGGPALFLALAPGEDVKEIA